MRRSVLGPPGWDRESGCGGHVTSHAAMVINARMRFGGNCLTAASVPRVAGGHGCGVGAPGSAARRGGVDAMIGARRLVGCGHRLLHLRMGKSAQLPYSGEAVGCARPVSGKCVRSRGSGDRSEAPVR